MSALAFTLALVTVAWAKQEEDSMKTFKEAVEKMFWIPPKCTGSAIPIQGKSSQFKRVKKDTPIFFDFNKKVTNVDEIFLLLMMSPFTSEKLDEFYPLYRDGKVKIKIVPRSELNVKLKKDVPAASFNHDLKEIRLSNDLELGIAAPLLIHEMEHALEELVTNTNPDCKEIRDKAIATFKEYSRQAAAKFNRKSEEVTLRDFTSKQIDELENLRESFGKCRSIQAFYSERFAYQSQSATFKALGRVFPCYKDYVNAHEEHGYIIRPQSSQEIIEIYDLDSKAITDHIKRNHPIRGAP